MDLYSNDDPLHKTELDCDFIWNKPKRIKVEIKEESINDVELDIKEEPIANYELDRENQSNSPPVNFNITVVDVQTLDTSNASTVKTKKKKSKKSAKTKIVKNVLPPTNLTIEKDDFVKCPSCYKCFDSKVLPYHLWKHQGINKSLFHQLTYKVPKKPNEKTQSDKKMSSLKCSKCLAEFDNISQLKIHIISHIVDNIKKAIEDGQLEEYYKCEVCLSEPFSDADDFKLHLQEHAQLVLHKCQVCLRKFLDLDELDAHSKKFNHFTCIICLKNLDNESMINEHLEYHVKNKPKSCVYCKKFFYFEVDLNAHIEDLHFSKFSYKCDKCNNVFATARLRCEHLWKAHYKR